MAARRKAATKKAAVGKSVGGRPPKRSAAMDEEIASALRDGCSIETACAKVRIARSTLDQWRKGDPGFRALVSEAKAQGIASRAEKLREQCELGNPQALQFWLSRRAPEFREPKDQPLPLDIEGIESAEDLGALVRQMVRVAITEGAAPGALSAQVSSIGDAAKVLEFTELAQRLKALEEK